MISNNPEPAAVSGGAAAPAPASEAEGRRFDQPDISRAAAKVDPALVQRQDPEETERSLRAALATLQRMSGAG
jgi:hypothetical protein